LIGFPIKEQDIKVIFKAHDEDRDGFIDYKEFAEIFFNKKAPKKINFNDLKSNKSSDSDSKRVSAITET
jgi:hypothetical protein